MPIETPVTRKDFDYLRWYLIHGKISLFVDGETWFLMVHNVCDHLQEDYRCGMYDGRPQICRDYTTDDCEYDGDGLYDMLFECAEQIAEFSEAFQPQEPRANPSASSPTPTSAGSRPASRRCKYQRDENAHRHRRSGEDRRLGRRRS